MKICVLSDSLIQIVDAILHQQVNLTMVAFIFCNLAIIMNKESLVHSTYSITEFIF